MAVSRIDEAGLNVAQYGNRNLVINGAMQVAQRGTSVSGSTGFYALDRWRGYSASSFPITQETFTLGQTDVPNEPKNYLRIGTGAAVKAVSQRIEGVRTGAGQTLTLSFYAKASAAFDLVMGYTQFFGSGGSAGVSATFETLSITTAWQKFEVTFTLPSISGKTIGAGDFLQVTFADGGTYIPAATTFDITQVQLEVGDTATGFEHRFYGDELARCQRYYCEISDGLQMVNFVVDNNFGIRRGSVLFPQKMRAAPTATGSINDGTLFLTTYADGVQLSQSGGTSNSTPSISNLTFSAEL